MKNVKGFSLVEIMVILGAIGGIALLVVKLGQSTNKIQVEAATTRDYNDLQREVHFILQNQSFCKASLSGTKFLPSDLGKPLSNMELWTSDGKGLRDKKRFAKGSKQGALTLEDITLTIGKDTTEALRDGTVTRQSASAVVTVLPSSKSKDNKASAIDQSIYVTFSRDDNGKMTIIDCENLKNSTRDVSKVWCGTVLNPCGSEIINAVAIGKYDEGRFTGVFEATTSVDFKLCKGAINQPATLHPCEAVKD